MTPGWFCCACWGSGHWHVGAQWQNNVFCFSPSILDHSLHSWGFLTCCRALSCLSLGWEIIPRSLGSESCFPPSISLNSNWYFPAQPFPTIRSFSSKFSLLFPWIIKCLQATVLHGTVPSPDPSWIFWTVQVPGTSFHLFQPIASSSNEFLVLARDFPLIPLLRWSCLLKIPSKFQSWFDYSLICAESPNDFSAPLDHLYQFSANSVLVITPLPSCSAAHVPSAAFSHAWAS